MEFSRRTTQILYEDHCATSVMLNALEHMIAHTGQGVPDVGDGQVRQVLENTAKAIDQEVRDHFAFEENELFTRLEENGENGIVDLLLEEHKIMLPIGNEIAASAKAALTTGFSAEGWSEFRSKAGEFIEHLQAHILKEDAALLPLVDDLLDAEIDMQLAESHSMNE